MVKEELESAKQEVLEQESQINEQDFELIVVRAELESVKQEVLRLRLENLNLTMEWNSAGDV